MKAFLLGVLILNFSLLSFANWDQENAKIEYLIHAVETSGVTFIRAGQEYDGQTAAAHLRDKLNSALSNPFLGNRDSFTADDFIEKIASKSFLSGRPYLIKLDSGDTVTAREWLYGILSQMNSK